MRAIDGKPFEIVPAPQTVSTLALATRVVQVRDFRKY
jgi:hypothetical protein